jgi:hypothetical protein
LRYIPLFANTIVESCLLASANLFEAPRYSLSGKHRHASRCTKAKRRSIIALGWCLQISHHGLGETSNAAHTSPPTFPGHLRLSNLDGINDLFTTPGVKGRIRPFEPVLTSFKDSDNLFLFHDWVYVLAEKEVEASLKRALPEGFLEVVKGKNL